MRVLHLIDKWGNETTIYSLGQMNRIKHQKVLAVLEKRALRYRNVIGQRDWERGVKHGGLVDETGTLEMAGLVDEVDRVRG